MSVFKEVKKHWIINEEKEYHKLNPNGEKSEISVRVIDCYQINGGKYTFTCEAKNVGYRVHDHFNYTVKGCMSEEDAYEELLREFIVFYGYVI